MLGEYKYKSICVSNTYKVHIYACIIVYVCMVKMIKNQEN